MHCIYACKCWFPGLHRIRNRSDLSQHNNYGLVKELTNYNNIRLIACAHMHCTYLIEPALPLPGTGLVQALEGGVPKLVLHCLVSETVGHNVLFTARQTDELFLASIRINNKKLVTMTLQLAIHH